jgi:hypothetical protein
MLFNKKIKGLIGYFGLNEFWESRLSKQDRKILVDLYGEDLINGDWTTSRTKIGFFSDIIGYMKKPELYQIGLKILNEGDKYCQDSINIVDLHFYYQGKIEFLYRFREIGENLNSAIQACLDQIMIAPKVALAFKNEYKNEPLPVHVGFIQLAIIREKQKDYVGAIEVCKEAMRQGWREDWETRILRLNKRISK